ncbi:hypothetical protein ARTSIC4J27_249 [Pseudarthrobacter siccitolerans]|uniref:HNH endonuclease n=1 Tax=Pseudarthrobacter siccitolerans TaxID=861266 RepID=A0A024GWL4_9MICC|nr:hypothetical protein [Pseudarthrobacter siccitolerans]CCQ44325.1 hypothetical protein ARTSIC4J27_249 [Pseudarthrobacter siccitolerans]
MSDPVAERLASVASRYGEPLALTAQALARLEYRRRHSGKTCAKCQHVRPLSAFTTDTRKPDGLSSRCKSCEAQRQRERRASRRV